MAEFGGALAHHMAVHILAMNLAAPLAAFFFRAFNPVTGWSISRWLWPAVALQLALLVGWHLPVVLAFAFASDAALAAMHLSLFLAALWFWLAVFAAADETAWRSLAALLGTGKIFCLVGVLLAFAPRPIYAAVGMSHGSAPPSASELLADQQLAGLLMLIACPLAYVLAGIVIAARWLSAIDKPPEAGVRQRAS
jgi:putative membrane protein